MGGEGGGVDVYLHMSFTLALLWGWVVGFRPGHFTPGKESEAPLLVWTFYADVLSWLGVGDRGIQTLIWCCEDHAWGTQLLVVLKNTQLNLINFLNTTIHPSVSLWWPRHNTTMVHIPPNKVSTLALE